MSDGLDVDAREPAPPDLRLVVPAVGAWSGAFFALGCPPGPVLGIAGAVMVALPAALLVLRHRRGALPAAALVLAAGLACAAGGAVSAALRVDAVGSGPVPELAARRATVSVELVVTGDPKRHRAGPSRPDLVLVPARLEHLDAGTVELRARLPVLVMTDDPGWLAPLPGQRVAAEGRLGPPRPGDSVAAVLSARGSPAEVARPGPVQRAAGSLRAGLRDAVSGLSPPERGLVPGLVVGDTSALPEDLEEDFRTAGLTHLVAVSGANCAIVLGAVLLAARWVGVRGRVLPLLGALALLGFLVLARPQPSVLRATVMGLVAVAALASGRRRLGLPALGAAALALVLADPWLARSYGYALSVLATAGLLVLAAPWTDRLARRLPRWLAAALAVPMAAQAVCGPVVVLLSSQVSLAAVPANLLVAPAVAPATVFGVLAAVLAPLGDAPAAAAGTVAGWAAWWIVTVATTAADVPMASVGWPAGPRGALLLALVTVLAVVVAPRLLRRPRMLALTAALAAGALTPGAVRQAAWPPPGWDIVACDVGQGDAFVLATGDGSAVVVDAGPDPDPVDRCLRELGVHIVPALVLTHLHADHVDGLEGVLRRRAVAELVVGPLTEPAASPGAVRRLHETAAAAGIPVRQARAGETSEIGGVRWTVLGPGEILSDGSPPNNASVVMSVESGGLRLLLTGDIEPSAQLRVLRRLDADADGSADAGPFDVLKVPHHGSANQLPAMFEVVAARVGLVSVGAGNDYGHPASATLGLLERAGTSAERTDERGDVAVLGPSGDLRVVHRR